MHFLSEYGLFLAKLATLVVALLVIVGFIAAMASRSKEAKDKLKIRKINKKYDDFRQILESETFEKSALKQKIKAEKKLKKKSQKKSTPVRRKIFILDFIGDIKASATQSLREEVTALLTIANPQDEVVVRLESPGGLVPSYGLAASQLKRIRDHNIPLTVTVDKVAASGGYMMACVADQIIAAPFAIIGSIGVIAQLPNFHRFLKKKDIDFEQIMAGQYKRTLSMFGENTEKGREKVKEDVENIHKIFKEFIVEYRPKVNIDEVATGEHWHGQQALQLKLVDSLLTSDDYLLNASKEADIYELHYAPKKSLASKLSLPLQRSVSHLFDLILTKSQRPFY